MTDQRPEDGRPRWLGLLILGMVVMLLGVAAVTANAWKGTLRIGHVDTYGNRIVSRAEILGLAKIPSDARLFALDLQAIRRRVQENTFVKSVSVNREVPNRIVITVVERTPVAALAMDRTLYIDAEGMALPATRSEFLFDLPVITGAGAECTPGKKIITGPVSEAMEILLTAAQVSDELSRRISEVHCSGERDIVLTMADGGVPVIFGHGNIAGKLVTLDGFWQSCVVGRGAQDLQYIDLRFMDQVVVRWHG